MGSLLSLVRDSPVRDELTADEIAEADSIRRRWREAERPRTSPFLEGRITRRRRRLEARRITPVIDRVQLIQDYRLAKIRHAIEHGFQDWEIVALVPGPASAEELELIAELRGNLTEAAS